MSDITVGSHWLHMDQELEVINIRLRDDRCIVITYRYLAENEESSALMSDFLKNMTPIDDSSKIKHSHYHKDVSDYDTIDIYAVCKIFDVQDTSGCLQHAIKKLLVTGKRGHKDRKTDIQNAIDTLNRLLELEHE